MKTVSLILFIAIPFLFSNCNKSNSAPAPAANISCDGLVTDTLGTNDNGKIYMPTAFTPNADGLNDVIRPITSNISSLAFTIYDIGNNVVFTTNSSQGWTVTTDNNVSTKYHFRIQALTSGNHHIGLCGDLYRLTCLPSSIPIASLHFEDQLTQNGFTGTTSEFLPVCP